jgi:Bacterial PH domain
VSRLRSILTETCLHPTEDAAALQPFSTPLTTLLTGHILRDGEVVLLTIKPSLWFIPLQSLFFAAVVVLLAGTILLVGPNTEHRRLFYLDAVVFLIGLRLMLASLQWMGRLYVLTDQRILRFAGVFSVDIFDCPLRKVAGVRVVRTFREKLFGLGTLEIHPRDEQWRIAGWQTINHPNEVHAKVAAAIHRAQQ